MLKTRPRAPDGHVLAAGLLLGMGIDALAGDPRRAHPVAAYGAATGRLQRWVERDSRLAGLVYWLLSVGAVALAGTAGSRATRRWPAGRLLLTAWSTWAVIGGTTLGREASSLGTSIAAADLDAARRRLPHLCGRDPTFLDGTAMLRATIESVAENSGDAVVSPLLWGAALGVPGLLSFRALNTLDAMVGHRSDRYLRFGWASARLDDVAGYLPARLGAAIVCLLAPVVGGRPRAAALAWRRDAAAHPSPNAGPLEATFAGALGIRLGGRVTYSYGDSDRPWLNPGGRDPGPGDVERAVRLSRAVSVATLAVAMGLAGLIRSLRLTGGRPRWQR